ncbi:amino acid permease [Salmonella enterica]|nr:amino acid permease [Salmonella enterica]
MPNVQEKQLRWYNIALMSFITVWGFGNVVNNYANQGLVVVFSWVFIFALYFIPYALIVGQLGSTFKEGKGGVSTWIKHTMGPGLAYLAAWTYWVVHIPYLAQKPQAILIALGWALKGDGSLIKEYTVVALQGLTLALFVFFMWVASRGMKSLKVVGSVAGIAMFIMSILYVVMAVTAPAITNVEIATTNITWQSFIPHIDFTYITTISMLVFAVGGAEKISPYVNQTRNPGKEFPKGMLFLAVMVAVCAILGSLAMGMMFDSRHIPDDLMTNGQYYAFQKLGEYYHMGNSLMVIYAIANTLGQIAALVFSIDAPLKVLLGDADSKYIPQRYLWVFVAFIAVIRLAQKYKPEYVFIRNRALALTVGIWCFAFTAFACLTGIFPKMEAFTPEWTFQLTLNIVTPFVLVGLGLIFPLLARRNT